MARNHLITATRRTLLINSPQISRKLKPEQQREVAPGTAIEITEAQVVGLYVRIRVKGPPEPDWETAWADAQDWEWGAALDSPAIAIARADAAAGALVEGKQDFVEEKINVLNIKTKRKTLLKLELKSSADLPKRKLLPLEEGDSIPCKSCVPDKHQHLRIELAYPASDGSTEFFAYAPHVELPQSAHQSAINLNVPHYDQVDNQTHLHGTGHRQCNLTSAAMIAAYCKPDFVAESKAKGYPEPESYLGEKVATYGDTTDHTAITKGLKDIGIDSYFSYSLCPKDLVRSLSQGKLPDGRVGIPVLLGTAYKGSGHMIVLRGRDEASRKWFINDPYGCRAGTSNSYAIIGNKAGENDEVSDDWMDACYWDMGGESGWGRIITSIDGVPTGLPAGL